VAVLPGFGQISDLLPFTTDRFYIGNIVLKLNPNHLYENDHGEWLPGL